MSTKDFTANVISATKVVPDGNFKDSKASGIWDINEALDLIKGGNWPNVANLNPAAFVDALFQTTLWSGSGSARSITNNIDLSTKEGLVWIKKRSGGANHTLQDTVRGATKHIRSSGDSSEGTEAQTITAFNSDGFSLGTDDITNASGSTYVGWTFRSQPKFFDVVTYEGTGSARTVAHSLNTTVGMILVKNRDAADNWAVYHRGNTGAPETDYLILNTGAGTADDSAWWNDTAPTSSVFTVGTDHSVNASGENYVAYLFAHNNDDGGFGEPGDQDIIKCDTYTGNGSTDGPTITLGFEPQFFMTKRTDGSSGSWEVVDTMRGFTFDNDNTVVDNAGDRVIRWQSSGGENDSLPIGRPTATGFKLTTDESQSNGSSKEYIYMAIRRGGMQTPTAASDVFNVTRTPDNASTTAAFDIGFVSDFVIHRETDATAVPYVFTRLLGGQHHLRTSGNNAEADSTVALGYDWTLQNSVENNVDGGDPHIFYNWKRARGYFDVVAYTGTGSARTVAHNLGVAPEMMWVKNRDNADDWAIYYGDNTDYLNLNDTGATADSASRWNDTSPTSSVFTVGTDHSVNASGENYISYLFATATGVSKIGTYSGTGSSQNIDCGFTAGSSFVLVKRYDGVDSWYIADSVRGISSGQTDKIIKLNSTDAEFTESDNSADYIAPHASGFNLPANSPFNGSGDDFLFYAIAAIS